MSLRYDGYFQMLLLQCDYTSTKINHFIANAFSEKEEKFDFEKFVMQSVIQIEFPKGTKKKKKKKFKVPSLRLDGL